MQEEDGGPQIERHIVFEDLTWPGRDDDLTDSAGGNRQYIDLRFMSWTEAKSVLAAEQSMLLEQATRSDAVIDDRWSGDEDAEDDVDDPLFGLDLGVASTVIALSAARCIPFYSCNGDRGHLQHYPVVVCWARPQRVLDLLEIAEEADCGIANDDHGIGAVLVYTDDVRKMVEFARILIERRNRLRKVKQAKRPQPGGVRASRPRPEVQSELAYPSEL